MDARQFKAPYLRRTDIWSQADELRQRPLPQATLSVPVLDLAEFDLGLELVPKPNLRRADDIDALLLGDLKTIVVDRDAFKDRRAENRLRFSVAHEIGHLILHRDIYAGLQHSKAKEWFDYISAIPVVEYGWVERQANSGSSRSPRGSETSRRFRAHPSEMNCCEADSTRLFSRHEKPNQRHSDGTKRLAGRCCEDKKAWAAQGEEFSQDDA